MNYFLAKTDPDTYSINDFIREQETLWDGVHNFQAINAIKAMRPGDQVFIYHSQSDKAIVGLAEVAGLSFEKKEDTRNSWVVRIRLLKNYSAPLSLAVIKADLPEANNFVLVRNSRLSTMPVPNEIASWLLERLDNEVSRS